MEFILYFILGLAIGKILGSFFRLALKDQKKINQETETEKEHLRDQKLCPPHIWERIKGEGLICKICKIKPGH